MEAPLKDCTTLEQGAVIRFLNSEGIQTSQICQRMKNIYVDNLNISYGTVHTIIKGQLQFRKICCRWIPHFLNLDQKLNRIWVSKALLKRYEEEGDHFLDQIVTGDESWCYHYDPSTKRASMEWKRGDSPRPKKIRSQRSAGKVLLTIFWDVDGPICLDFLSSRQRMNSDLYCDILVNKLKPGIRNKRRGKLSKGVLFLHDNARPHASCKTVFTIIKLGFEVLEHPAYSPDLAPSDYFLFGLLKKELKGKRFDSDEDVQKVVQDFFHTLPKSAYKEGIFKLPEQRRQCKESQDRASQKMKPKPKLLRKYSRRDLVQNSSYSKMSIKQTSRIILTKEELDKLSKEDLINKWQLQESYLKYLESKNASPPLESCEHHQVAGRLNADSDPAKVRDLEEKLQQQKAESTRRENILVQRLSTKIHEKEECFKWRNQILGNISVKSLSIWYMVSGCDGVQAQLQYLKQSLSPPSHLKSLLVDPAVKLLFDKMQSELEEKKTELAELQNEMSAWKFTPDRSAIANNGQHSNLPCGKEEYLKLVPNAFNQLDETTDISNKAQLLAFLRFVDTGKIVNNYFFCKELKQRTTGADIFELVDENVMKYNLRWENCVSVCTDGAPAMKGSRKGLIAHVIKKNPNIKFVHCMIHREMLASKSVPPILVTTLDEVVKVVNYIKSNALRSRIFSTFCEAMDSDYKNLLFHTEVRWLSKGKVLNRFISMKNEIMAFIDNEEINFPFMMSDVWWLRVSFLGDIFDKLNSLNLNLQGAQENIITISTKLKAFKEKLSLWNLNIAKENFASFPMVQENPSKSIIKK
ncbi:hypothetical protein LAZ67_1001772 [Cordylochernes scorpioides]|uniref:Transposase n=1 Tax=Cordylochernes scorpioides TaxID=51811 RepID=A0ABY6JVP4_9ARAC|nr:hypothetical protein LAZ67_1001772 [Cordylochernes scorpioides]